MSGHAARPWRSQRAALAELPRKAMSVVTREVEPGLSATDLENPSQTICKHTAKRPSSPDEHTVLMLPQWKVGHVSARNIFLLQLTITLYMWLYCNIGCINQVHYCQSHLHRHRENTA